MSTGGARAETIRYHEALYAGRGGAGDGSWLDRPSPHVLRAAALVTGARRVLDLGCGTGRHALAIAEGCPAGSEVVAVDLLPVAVERLRAAARERGVADRVTGVVADVEHVALGGPFDLVVACSVLEHVSSLGALDAVLARCAAAVRPGGVACLLVLADRREVLPDGAVRPALTELDLRAVDAERAVARAFAGWEEVERSRDRQGVPEERDGAPYVLEGEVLRWTLRRPG